jgi:hypothetical protein
VKVASLRVHGMEVPSYLLHNPLLETLQLGATVRRVADSKLRKRDTGPQGIEAGLVAGGLGLTEEIPFMREMLEVGKAFEANTRRAFFGELTKGIAVPQLVQWAAAKTDKTPSGQPVQRKPDTMMEHIETGVPGLRERVPEKISPDVAAVAGEIMRGFQGGTVAERERARDLITQRLQEQTDRGRDFSKPALYVKINDLRAEDAVAAWQAADEPTKQQFAPQLIDRIQRAYAGGKLDAATTSRLVKTVLPYYQAAQPQAMPATAAQINGLRSAIFSP